MNCGSHWKIGVVAAALILSVTGQGVCFPLIVKDDRNKDIEITARPQRIISLAPTNTELLFSLGLEKEIVGVTSFCDYPEAAKQKEKVGGFLEVNAERIVALKPDVILAFGTMQLPIAEALEKRGLIVFWLYPRTVNDIMDSFERVGRLTGAEQQARRLRDAVEKDISELRKTLAASNKQSPTVFRVMDFNRPATIGKESFQTDLFSLAGGKNAFPAEGKDYVEMDESELIKRDPTFILVCGDDEKALKEQLKKSPVYKNLTAVRNDAIVVMPCELTCRPGPRIGLMARRLAHALHPEIPELSSEAVSAGTPARARSRANGGCGCSSE